jgi:hypothetical protein
MNHKLRDYGRPAGYDEFAGHLSDFEQPLVNQPGEGWEYGVMNTLINSDKATTNLM